MVIVVVCLLVCLFVCFCLFVCLFFVCLFVCLFLFVCLSGFFVCLFVCLFLFVCFCLHTSLLWSVMSSRTRVTTSLHTEDEQCLLARNSPLSTSRRTSFTSCTQRETKMVTFAG